MSTFFWLVIAALMAVIEAISYGLITVWFVVGALVAFLASLVGADIFVQAIIFVVVSVVCLVLIRPIVLKYRKHGEFFESTPVGQNAVVIEDIDNAALKGRVETPDHMTWAAVSADGSNVKAGSTVRVVNQQSVKLIVERI